MSGPGPQPSTVQSPRHHETTASGIGLDGMAANLPDRSHASALVDSGTPVPRNSLAAIVLVTALAGLLRTKAEEPQPFAQAEIMHKDQRATVRFLQLRLEKVQRLMKRGSEEEAAKAEAECVRHEVKSLQRCLWMMKQERRLASKARALAAEIEKLKLKPAQVSLQERRQAGFRIHPLVLDPLSIAGSNPEDSSNPTVTALQPKGVREAEEREQRVRSKPPPPEAPPPPGGGDDAGSAGSGGSATDRR